MNEKLMINEAVYGSLMECWIKLEKCENTSFLVHFQYLPMGEQEIWYCKEDKTIGIISTNYGEEIYSELKLMPMSELLSLDSLNFDEQVIMTILHRYY